MMMMKHNKKGRCISNKKINIEDSGQLTKIFSKKYTL